MTHRIQAQLAARISYILLAFLVIYAVAFIPSTQAEETQKKLPVNTINISFDLVESSMTGTSRITLPPDTPLTLYFGQLEVTGSILEIEGKTPLSLKPADENIFVIHKAPYEQSVYVSWNLTTKGMFDNLISESGITLAGLWHPIPNIDMAYRLEAKLPDGFTAISEGETLTYGMDKFNNKYLTTAFDHPIQAIHFAAGPYTVKSRTLPNDIILSAFFFEEDLALADEYLDKAENYLKLYQDMIGPYPYNRYSIVENRLPTGFGMPTFTLLGQAVVRLPFIKDTSLGHEILHSWFGNSIMTKEVGGNWSEGLTTYLADQYYAEQKEMDPEYRKNQLLRYSSYVPEDNDVTLQDFFNASHSQPMARHIRAVGYDKSSMVFHMLRKKLGDDLFFQGLKLFYLKYRYKRAGWDEIEDNFSNISDQDLSDFFDQWLTRWDIPKLNIDNIDISQVKGQSKLSFILKQRNVQPYSFQLPVLVNTRNKQISKTIDITEQDQPVEIFTNALPVELLIDPEYDLMRSVSFRETPPLLSHFFGAENKIASLPSSEAEAEKYTPLLPFLERMGADIVTSDELDNNDLDEGSFLFLGFSKHVLGLFAEPNHSEKGVTVDVRSNPLAPGEVIMLITSPDKEQTQSIVRKLSHYGKYSYLYFENGRLSKKETLPTDKGIRIELFSEPEAVRTPDIRSFDEIIAEIKESKVVYVGEMHTDMGSHLLQLQVIQALYEEDPNLAIGMEMFPRSSQEILDQYIDGTIETEKEFLKQSDYFEVWRFDYRLYSDIIAYAKRNGIPLVGLNIEKAIVSQVFKEGDLDGLEEEQFESVPSERKLDIPGYRQRLIEAFSAHNRQSFTQDKIGGFIQAQSIWDETMAESIVDYMKANPERRMVIIAGNGHVYKDSAIPSRVKRRLDVPQSVISSIGTGDTGLIQGYKVDYLVYTESMKLDPAPKVGVVLKTEEIEDDPEKTRLRIIKISPHGKALEAGVKENDIILSIDDQPVESIGDMKIILFDKKVGDIVTMKVFREHFFFADEELELEVELSSPMQMGMMPPTHPK